MFQKLPLTQKRGGVAEGCPSTRQGLLWGISPIQRQTLMWHSRGGLGPPPTQDPLLDPFHHTTPSLLRGSLTQFPEELHSQGGVDEEEQHKEEAQVAHLWE